MEQMLTEVPLVRPANEDSFEEEVETRVLPPIEWKKTERKSGRSSPIKTPRVVYPLNYHQLLELAEKEQTTPWVSDEEAEDPIAVAAAELISARRLREPFRTEKIKKAERNLKDLMQGLASASNE